MTFLQVKIWSVLFQVFQDTWDSGKFSYSFELWRVISNPALLTEFKYHRPFFLFPPGAEEAGRCNPFPCSTSLQERRLAQIILIRWCDLSSTLFKASYLHYLTAALFFPWQLLAMHESQVKCISFSGCMPGRQKYNYVLQVDSYLSLLHFPTDSQRFLRAFHKYFTVCQVAVPLWKKHYCITQKGLYAPYHWAQKQPV